MSWRAALASAAAALLAACAGAPVALPQSDGDAAAMREHPERLIVLAVANAKDPIPTRAGTTVAAYALARQFFMLSAMPRMRVK